MASSTLDYEPSSAPAAFPLELAKGIMRDLVVKELDARLFPASDAKKGAFVAAREALPRRLALLAAQIQAAGSNSTRVIKGFCALLRDFLQSVFAAIIKSEAALADLTAQGSSLWMETLRSILVSSCDASVDVKEQLVTGGRLVTACLGAVGEFFYKSNSTPEERLRLVPVIRWLAEDVISGRFGVADAWGLSLSLEHAFGSPLVAIAANGLPEFIPLALEHGCSVNGDFRHHSGIAPAAVAFSYGHIDVVEALLAQGLDLTRPYERFGQPLLLAMFQEARGRADFLTDLLSKRPGVLPALVSGDAGLASKFLFAAIKSHAPALVDLVLSAGAPLEYQCLGTWQTGPVEPSLVTAITVGNAPILELLITKGKALEGWEDKYDETARCFISEALCKLAIGAYCTDSSFTDLDVPQHMYQPNPDAMVCVELVLAAGFVHSWNVSGDNSLLSLMYSCPGAPGEARCHIQETHELGLLRRFRAAGFDVVSDNVSAASLPELPRLAIASGSATLLDVCLSEFGVSPEAEVEAPPFWVMDGRRAARDKHSLLTAAFRCKSVPCIKLLLDKYKVSVAYPERPLRAQPVVALLATLDSYNDAQVGALLRALVERDPSLFDLPCYSNVAIAEVESEAKTLLCDENVSLEVAWNPVYQLTVHGKPQTLEYLLTRKLPGVAAMVNRPAGDHTDFGRSYTAARAAVEKHQWKALDILLRLSDAQVTNFLDGDGAAAVRRRALGWNEDEFVSAAALMRRYASQGYAAPPRALVAMVEARAKKELDQEAAKAKTAAASQAAGAVTNAFEDPSCDPLTEPEKGEKRKAKKKAAKKKAKAKKRLVAANAGAGREDALPGCGCDGSSDDDDDGPHEEEPDDNLVDSRNAPSLDLMLEQMGLKEKHGNGK